jgi:hypothetical protein
MSLDRLYAELGVEFQPEEQEDFFHELTDVARNHRGWLGDESATNDVADKLELLAQELGKERVNFAPRLAVVSLQTKLFADLKLEAPPYTRQLFDRFNFYLVDFPISMIPRPGGGFGQLDCIVEFNPDAASEKRPVAYQVFPQEEWEEVIHAWQGVNIGIDENLEFKVDPLQAADVLPTLSLPLKAAVELKTAAKAGLVLGPFDYHIRRQKILSRGKGDAKVYWRLESENEIMENQPRFGVVLQVPKDVERVDVIGALVARRTFHFFTGKLQYLLEYVSDRARTFFEKGAPATDKKSWNHITNGV